MRLHVLKICKGQNVRTVGELLGSFASGAAATVTDTVPRLPGRAAVSFEQSARDHRAAFLTWRGSRKSKSDFHYLSNRRQHEPITIVTNHELERPECFESRPPQTDGHCHCQSRRFHDYQLADRLLAERIVAPVPRSKKISPTTQSGA